VITNIDRIKYAMLSVWNKYVIFYNAYLMASQTEYPLCPYESVVM